MCATRWPNVICGGVGLKENLSAGMVSTAPCRFLACRGRISLITVVTGFFFCANNAGQRAHRTTHRKQRFIKKPPGIMQKAYPGSCESVISWQGPLFRLAGLCSRSRRVFPSGRRQALLLRHLHREFFDFGQIALHLAPSVPQRVVGTPVECSLKRAHAVLEIHNEQLLFNYGW